MAWLMRDVLAHRFRERFVAHADGKVRVATERGRLPPEVGSEVDDLDVAVDRPATLLDEDNELRRHPIMREVFLCYHRPSLLSQLGGTDLLCIISQKNNLSSVPAFVL